MYLRVCVLSLFYISALAVPKTPATKFKFTNSLFRRSRDCNICYGADCISIDQASCDYYTEADNMLQKEGEDPEGFPELQLRGDVDGMMYDIVDKVSQSSGKECIPFISRYTDCTKENVCLGCKICQCMENGRWKCSSRNCHFQDPDVDVDHRVLLMTIQKLSEYQQQYLRKKRSVTVNPLELTNASTLTFQELSEWMYGVESEHKHELNGEKPNEILPHTKNAKAIEHLNNAPKSEPSDVTTTTMNDIVDPTLTSYTTETVIKPHSKYITPGTPSINKITTEADYLAFDEVLNNIAIDSKNYTRRKPLLDILPYPVYNKTADFDYMLIDEDKSINTTATENVTEMAYVVNFVEDNDATESSVSEATKVVIDLLETAKKDPLFNNTDYVDLNPNREDLVGFGFDNTNDIFDNNQLNVMKREVATLGETNTTMNATSNIHTNDTNVDNEQNKTIPQEEKPDLKNNVLLPIVKLINSKQNDVEILKKIKENLITFMNHYNQSPIVEIIDYPNMSDTNMVRDIEMFPDLEYDLRRSNPHIMKKLLYKIKADIYEILKDIIGLERFKKGRLPKDLSVLIHSLKRYVSKNRSHKKHLKEKETQLNYRRNLQIPSSKCQESTLKQCVIEIFERVDKNMPESNALGPLSVPVRRILRNIIRTYSYDEYTKISLKVHNPNYNMANDLNSIGDAWQDMSNNMIGNSPQMTLYKMKLIHLLLAKDINKINDALMLIEYAQGRRLLSNIKTISSNVIDQINKELNYVHNKFEVVVQYHSKNAANYVTLVKDNMGYNFRSFDNSTNLTSPTLGDKPNPDSHKKHSFITKIRNLLKSSRHDIGELLHRQVPKSEIVRQLARQKLDELAQKKYDDYENTMRKWQKNLGVVERHKRNAGGSISARIKNIIPKYLRRKVNPSLQKKNLTHKSNKQGQHQNLPDNHKKDKKTANPATNSRINTTTKSKTTQKPKKSKVTQKPQKSKRTQKPKKSEGNKYF